MIVKLFGNE